MDPKSLTKDLYANSIKLHYERITYKPPKKKAHNFTKLHGRSDITPTRIRVVLGSNRLTLCFTDHVFAKTFYNSRETVTNL
jgi:hypothetical protein